MRTANKLYKLFFIGFAIASLTAVFVSLGVYLILFILGSLPVSRNVLIFLTVLLYALAFAIARAGMKLKIDLPFFGFKDDEEASDKTRITDRRRPYILKVLAFIWLITGIFSVLWLTPSFIIFWFSLHYPRGVITLFSFAFSIFAAIIYYFRKDDIIVSIKDRLIYFSGGCAGSLIAICISYFLMSNRIFVTWE